MRDWFKKRAAEPTSYIGLALLVQAIGTLTKMNEAPAIADAIHSAAEPLARGDYATAGTVAVGGLLAILMREKGGK